VRRASKNTTSATGLSRRNFVLAAAGTGAAVVAAVVLPEGYSSAAVTAAAQGSGTVPAWSAMTDPVDAYGVAYFQVDPGRPGGDTTITVTYYHAPTQKSGTPDYSVLESFQLTRPRRDDRSSGRSGNDKKALAADR
jgi:hypothetical protein